MHLLAEHLRKDCCHVVDKNQASDSQGVGLALVATFGDLAVFKGLFPIGLAIEFPGVAQAPTGRLG